MKVHFSIVYKTHWGENLFINTSTSPQKIPLHTTDGLTWSADADIKFHKFAYHYFVEENNETTHSEQPLCHSINISDTTQKIFITDEWFEPAYSHPFFTSAFTKCFFPLESDNSHSKHKICISALPPQAGNWAICTDIPCLGGWQQPIQLKHIGACEWVFNVPTAVQKFEYKIVLVQHHNIIWEDGLNRQFRADRDAGIIQHICPRFNYALWKGAGIVIPVFSLRSEDSWGVGDFNDLQKLIRWAAKCSIKLIQILPINDTSATQTWRDSYPYSGISVFALHPLYINCNALGSIELRQKYSQKKQQLNQEKFMDYEAAYHCKMDFLKELFKEEGASAIQSAAFQKFVADNDHWLHPYVAFKYFCHQYCTSQYDSWNIKWRQYDKNLFDQYIKNIPQAQEEVNFYYYVQFILHCQLLQVKELAQSHHIALKGDLPIGVSRYSVETWTQPSLFYLKSQAGAPPDAFATQGQNWGFPTYNWEEMEKDQYAWWRRRLQHMNQYFDAFRIDHVLGFFRIWEIPDQQIEGILGYFRPALPFTLKEIEDYGFKFDGSIHIIPTLFASYVQQHTELLPYLIRVGKHYHLKNEVSTQKKICQQVQSTSIRNELLRCATEVLFIRDPQHPNLFHPRIDGQRTLQYARLSQQQQDAYNRLYNDFFYNRHNDFWRKEAMKKLPAVIQACSMLPCAEDLGMIPGCVQPTLKKLEILTLEIQRMPKQYGIPIADTRQYPYLSVCSIDTHDMAPLRLWWKESPMAAQYIWKSIVKQDAQVPQEVTPQIAQAVINDHLNSPSMLCVISMQDYLALFSKLKTLSPEEEQINIPANPQHYWRYRIPINIEELEDTPFYANIIASLILQSNR